MRFFDVVETRQSVRAYAPTQVPQEKIDAILAATSRAPSAGNYQSYEIYIVQSEGKRAALTKATYGQDFIAQAPVMLVFCANPSRCSYDPPSLYALEDATIACTFAMLAITDLGLAACWIGAFNPKAVLEVIGAPSSLTPVAILPFGFAAESPERTTRRSLADLVHPV